MNYTPDTSLCRLIILQLARSASPQGETRRRDGGGEAATAAERLENFTI